ncbi:MAG: hypothetical protein ACKOCD_00315, partial [Nitrospiraceae bacterium]
MEEKRSGMNGRDRSVRYVASIGLAWVVAAGWLAGVALAAQGGQAGAAGDAARGRSLFNGKGICFYCHGLDAHPDRLPKLALETAAYIAHLDPKPPHLR